jgi:tRNA threonylcarbamoyladenosine biosynthesis protein TsaE
VCPDSLQQRTFRTATADDTQLLGRAIAARLRGGEWLLLLGPLGAGKTTFVRGLARGLGYDGTVRSPTFTLVAVYGTRPVLVHADLYRLDEGASVDDLGLYDLAAEGDAVVVVEWADRCPELGLGRNAVAVSIALDEDPSCDIRSLRFSRSGSTSERFWREVECL